MDEWEVRQRRALEKWVEVGGIRYKIRRPRDLEMRHLLAQSKDIGEDLAMQFVVDWEVTEATLLPGIGGDAAVPFSAGAYREFIADRLPDLAALSNLIWDEYQAFRTAKESIAGKSGSS